MAHSITLSVGEILTIIALFMTLIGGIITAYTSLNVRVKALEVRVTQAEENQNNTDKKLETIRTENRQDHGAIMDKIDLALGFKK